MSQRTLASQADRRLSMLRQVLVGTGASVCNIAIHALVMAAVVRVEQLTSSKKARHPWLLLISVMVATVSVLMGAHTSEVSITPVEPWRLLGPITAMNGVLLFGWSTAVIFEVLRRTMVQPSVKESD
jgi:hypothetical protein